VVREPGWVVVCEWVGREVVLPSQSPIDSGWAGTARQGKSTCSQKRRRIAERPSIVKGTKRGKQTEEGAANNEEL